MADILTSKIRIPSLPNDILILKDAEARADLSVATATVTGNPINFTTLSAQKASSTQLSMEPIQEGSGDPSPSNVRAITGRTDATITVKDEGNITQSTVTISFGQTVYGGTLDVESGTLTVDIGIVDLGDLEWNYASANTYFRTHGLDSVVKYITTGQTNAICSQYKNVAPKSRLADFTEDSAFLVGANASSYKLLIRDTRYTNETAFTTAVTGVKLCYELDTPTVIQLTPHEVALLEGVNNISSDADGITLTYRDGKVATLGDLELFAKNLADCNDVQITNLQAGDVLVWDATAQKWKNQANSSTQVYSAEETIVGTWIDGRSVYERTITIPDAVTVPNNAWTTIFTDTFVGSISQILTADYANTSNGGSYNFFYMKPSENNLQYLFPGSGSLTISSGAVFIIRYIKS